jgi:comEA protein
MKKKNLRPPILEELFTPKERLALGTLLAVGIMGLAIKAIGLERVGKVEYRQHKIPQVAVNRATVEELEALPGIGPVTARRIMESRQRHGRFLTMKDLKRVKGIDSKTLEKLDGYVRFD